MEKLIVDRIVGDIAVLEKEDRNHIEVSVAEIGLNIKEGSILAFDGKTYSLDEVAEADRRRRIMQLQEKLKNR